MTVLLLAAVLLVVGPAEALTRYAAVVVDPASGVVPHAVVTVRIAGTLSPAALFSDVAGTLSLANPFTADGEGRFAFYISAGLYDVVPPSPVMPWALTIPGGWDRAEIQAWPALNLAVGLPDVSPYCPDARCLVLGAPWPYGTAELGLVGHRADAGGVSGRLLFFNQASPLADQRIGHLQVSGDGVSSGVLDFYASAAGAEHRVLSVVDVGGLALMGLGPMAPAEFLHMKISGHGGIAIERTSRYDGVDLYVVNNDSTLSNASREWVFRLADNLANGAYSRWMDVDPSGAARSRIEIAKMGPVAPGAPYVGVAVHTYGVQVRQADSGTHPLIATMMIDGLTVTASPTGSPVADLASLYIQRPPQGVASQHMPAALHIASGTTYLGAGVSFSQLGTARTFTLIGCWDCQRTTPCQPGGPGALAKKFPDGWDCR